MPNRHRPSCHRLATLFLCLMATFVLMACQPKDPNAPSNAKFYLTDGKVMLHKSHILSTKPTLYQPSFELVGMIESAQETIITSPTAGTLTHVAQPNQIVKKGETLATMLPVWHRKHYTTPPKSIAITANFTGMVERHFVKENAFLPKNTPILLLSDNQHFQFISIVPEMYGKKLSIGQSVNFTTARQNPQQDVQNFTGQVAKIIPDVSNNKHHPKLAITVQILPNQNAKLKKGMYISGRVSDDELNVGVLIPQYAFLDAEDFDTLKDPPYQPAFPLPAKVWVIRQDTSLHLSDVQIIAYQPDTQKFLVSGISEDSLIAAAPLPNSANGKLVQVY